MVKNCIACFHNEISLGSSYFKIFPLVLQVETVLQMMKKSPSVSPEAEPLHIVMVVVVVACVVEVGLWEYS